MGYVQPAAQCPHVANRQRWGREIEDQRLVDHHASLEKRVRVQQDGQTPSADFMRTVIPPVCYTDRVLMKVHVQRRTDAVSRVGARALPMEFLHKTYPCKTTFASTARCQFSSRIIKPTREGSPLAISRRHPRGSRSRPPRDRFASWRLSGSRSRLHGRDGPGDRLIHR